MLRREGGQIPSPEIEAGYRSLLRFSAEDVIAIHAEAASIGRTWDAGVRDRGTIDFIVERMQSLARARLAPSGIAAEAMVLIVREHSFWDANHRTGFQVADSILRAFGRHIVASRQDAERIVRGIDRLGLPSSAIRAWIARHIRRRR